MTTVRDVVEVGAARRAALAIEQARRVDDGLGPRNLVVVVFRTGWVRSPRSGGSVHTAVEVVVVADRWDIVVRAPERRADMVDRHREQAMREADLTAACYFGWPSVPCRIDSRIVGGVPDLIMVVGLLDGEAERETQRETGGQKG